MVVKTAPKRRTTGAKTASRTGTVNGAPTWTGCELVMKLDGQKIIDEQLTHKQLQTYWMKIHAMINKRGPGLYTLSIPVFNGPVPNRSTR